MVDFKSLLAASKAKQMEPSQNEKAEPEAPRKAMSFGRPQAPAVAQTSDVPAEDATRGNGDGKDVEQATGNAAAPKLAGLKLGFGRPPADGGNSRDGNESAGSAGLAHDLSLEALSNTALGEATSVSGYADETPATAPTRVLPEGLDKQQLGFVGLLDQVYTIMHDPELIGNVAKSIMVELKTRPEMKSLLGPDDARQLIRAARESMGLARIKKTETKQKRAGGTGRSSKAIDADIAGDLDSMLAGMGTT